MEISKLIQQMRLDKKLTMIDLANLIGCTQSSISQWEKGLSQPGPKYLKKLTEVFGHDFSVDNIDIIDNITAESNADYILSPKGILEKAILNLTESNKSLAESNQILAKCNSELMELQKNLVQKVENKLLSK